MVEITRVEEHSGYTISWGVLVYDGERLEETEKIVSIQYGGVTIILGQFVTANGRIGAPRGARGLVVALYVPDTDGRTTDIIDCLFEAHMMEPSPCAMKLKDLEV